MIINMAQQMRTTTPPNQRASPVPSQGYGQHRQVRSAALRSTATAGKGWREGEVLGAFISDRWRSRSGLQV